MVMDTRKTRRLVRLATAFAGLAWACTLSGCARDRAYTPYSPGTPTEPGRRVAWRPPFDREDVKKMFVGGYAGSDYNRETRPTPLRVRPMAMD